MVPLHEMFPSVFGGIVGGVWGTTADAQRMGATQQHMQQANWNAALASQGARHQAPIIDYAGMMNAWPYAQEQACAPPYPAAPVFARDWLFWGWLAAMAVGCALRWAW